MPSSYTKLSEQVHKVNHKRILDDLGHQPNDEPQNNNSSHRPTKERTNNCTATSECGAHMPVVDPPRVCAVCSHVFSALHRRAQEENEEQGKRPRPPRSIISCEHCAINLCLNSNSNCWVTWHTKADFLQYFYLAPLNFRGQLLKPILGWLYHKLWTMITTGNIIQHVHYFVFFFIFLFSDYHYYHLIIIIRKNTGS